MPTLAHPTTPGRARVPQMSSFDSEPRCFSPSSTLSPPEAEVYVEKTRKKGHRVNNLWWELRQWASGQQSTPFLSLWPQEVHFHRNKELGHLEFGFSLR